MSKPLRIAFGHKARVGKDTACNYLKNKYGGTILHFSDALYDIMNYAQKKCNFPEEKDPKFLQYIGTDWARSKNNNVWIDLTLQNLKDNENYFIGDVRFPNEIEALREHGFKCIKIVRPNRPIDRDTSHISEKALIDYSDWDYFMSNDRDIESFEMNIDDLVTNKLSL